MALSNWLELAVLMSVAAAGTLLWRLCRRKLRAYDGFEGLLKTRGKPPARRKLGVDEEIGRLESILDKKA